MSNDKIFRTYKVCMIVLKIAVILNIICLGVRIGSYAYMEISESVVEKCEVKKEANGECHNTVTFSECHYRCLGIFGIIMFFVTGISYGIAFLTYKPLVIFLIVACLLAILFKIKIKRYEV